MANGFLPTWGTSSKDISPPFKVSFPKPKKKKKQELTARQMMIILAARQREEHRSFGDILKGVGSGAVGGATWMLDKLMRPSWAVTAYIQERAVNGGSPREAAAAAWKGFKGERRQGFGQIFDELGVLEEHDFLRGGLGFMADVITDPLMWVTLGTAAPATIGARASASAAYRAAKAAGKPIDAKTVERAMREAGQRSIHGQWDDITEELLEAGGEHYAERLAHYRWLEELRQIPALDVNPAILQAQQTRTAISEARAFAEARLYDPRKIELILGTRKHGLRVPTGIPILTRPGRRLADKEIPIVSQLSDKFGQAFVPGFADPIYRAGELARTHAAETNAVAMREGVGRVLGDVGDRVSDNDMLAALHFMEEPLKKGPKTRWNSVIVAKDGTTILNPKYMEHLRKTNRINADQAEFITKYFRATEYLRFLDDAAGINPGNLAARTGTMYVPHAVRPGVQAPPTIAQTNLLTKAGYEKGRDTDVSLKRIKEWIDNKELDDIFETDPLAALWRRTRAGAERQADMALLNTLKASVAVPTRIVNPTRVGRAEARLGASQQAYEGAIRAAAHAEQAKSNKIQSAIDELDTILDEGTNALERLKRQRRTILKQKEVTKLENKIKKLKTAPPKLIYDVRQRDDGLWEFFTRAPKAKKVQVIGTRKSKSAARRAANDLERVRSKQKFKPDVNQIKKLERELSQLKKRRFIHPELIELDEQIKKVAQAHSKAVQALNNPRSRAHKNAIKDEEIALKAAKEAKTDAKKSVKQAADALRQARLGRRNPDLDSMLHVAEPSALDEWGNPVAFPRATADQIARLERFISGQDDIVDEFARGFGKVMAAWKITVTTVNPGYRIRNSMTDFWNMFVAGVPPWAMIEYGKEAADLMIRARSGDPIAVGFLNEAGQRGIMAGLFAGDIQAVAQMLRHQSRKKARSFAKKGQFIRAYTKAAQDFNRHAENWGRLVHYLYRRQSLGESPAMAAFNVKIAHFDYSDLTKFEQERMKKIFPFYTWTRKNIPYQVRAMFTNPGRYSAFPKLAQEAQYAAYGKQEGPVVQDYVSEAFGFPIPGFPGSFYMPQFGVSDLEVFQGPGPALERVGLQVAPFYKVPFELALNRSLFTGADIKGDAPRNPVTPFGAKILGLIPGSDVGPTSRLGPNDQRITGPGANPFYQYLAGQIPMARVALVTGPGSITAQRNKNAALLSFLGGQSVVQNYPELNALYNRLRIEEEVDRIRRGLQDEGWLPRTERKKSDFDKLIEEILGGNYRG